MKQSVKSAIPAYVFLLAAGIALVLLITTVVAGGETNLTDKTLVVWVSPANLTQRGGSALTVNDQSEWSITDPAVPASVVQSTRLFRERLLSDPYRPGYHFCIPEGNGRPGDSNGCFWANGRYHLMYKGVFYERNPEWTDDSEDNMCPSFLPLPRSADGGRPSDKHLLLFISHNKGCQYYIGDYENDRFIPTSHGRMTWVDNTYFAPEALIDDKGRQIAWVWLTDNPDGEEARGWSGVYGLPRSLWLGEDGRLRMRPVKELEMLRCDEKTWSDITLAGGKTRTLEGVVGDSCELEITIAPTLTAKKAGVKVRASASGEEETLLYYDAAAGELVFDSTKSGIDGRKTVERAPFELEEGESLRLRVFVDKSIVEIYANDRQAICRRVYPGRDDSLGVILFADGGEAEFKSVKAWEMMPSNPY